MVLQIKEMSIPINEELNDVLLISDKRVIGFDVAYSVAHPPCSRGSMEKSCICIPFF